ncbi:hypothetical protein KKH13_04650, partial [Patescibacteria group bacterium]|nr:hypothetical protein [Patescibacteria group bacterium]
FFKRYARARDEQADTLADEITYIADTEPDANKARVRVDARKWVAAKLKPKKYGDHQSLAVTDGDGGPLFKSADIPAEIREKLAGIADEMVKAAKKGGE